MERFSNSVAALLVVVAILCAGPVVAARQLVTPDNIDVLDQEMRVETLTTMYDELVNFDIFIPGDTYTRMRSGRAGLRVRGGGGEIAYAPISASVYEGEMRYSFSVRRDLLKHSSFFFFGYEIELRDWVSSDGPIKMHFLVVPQEVVAVGDTVYAAIRLTGIDRTELLFGSTCQVRYEVFDAGGHSVELLMDACGQSVTHIRLEPNETRDLPLSIPIRGWEAGEYSVECFVRQYRNKGLSKSFTIVVSDK